MNEITLSKIGGNQLVFVAAPYTAYDANGKEDVPRIMKRIETFSLCMEQLLKMGVLPYSPVLAHLVRCYTTKLPGSWDYWKQYSLTLLKKSDVMIVLTIEGWKESEGLKGEIEFAKEESIEIVYLDAEALLKGELEDLTEYIYNKKDQEFPREAPGTVKTIGMSSRSSIEYSDDDDVLEKGNPSLFSDNRDNDE